jgi:hypothetical protein
LIQVLLAPLVECLSVQRATFSVLMVSVMALATPALLHAQTRDQPTGEMRGYKISRAQIKVKRSAGDKSGADADKSGEPDLDALVQLGAPRLMGVSLLGFSFEVPVTIGPIEQGGRVDFITFENMRINDTPVTIDEYKNSFEIPNAQSLQLPDAITVSISVPYAVLGAVDDWRNSKELWPVTGRVFVFGHYRKFIFTVKRVIPVDLNLNIENPLTLQLIQPGKAVGAPAK